MAWAGICRNDAPGIRRLRRRLGADRVAVVPDLARAAAAVARLDIDLVVSWFWTKNVPSSFRGAGRLGAIGVHPSLLPRHRGPDPYFWTIDGGDTTTGVTAHALEDAYDTGAILGQRTLNVDPRWNAWTLAKRLDRPSLALLREIVGAYARGVPPAPVPQDDALATEAPAPSDDDLEIRWSWDAAAIERRVRAASPWPGAFTEICGETLTLTEVRRTTDYPKVLSPGQAFVRRDGVAIVRTVDGALELVRGRLDDDAPDLDASGLAEVVSAAANIDSL